MKIRYLFVCFFSSLYYLKKKKEKRLIFYGGVNDQCGVMSWAVQETGILPLLSCDSDMAAWLKHK